MVSLFHHFISGNRTFLFLKIYGSFIYNLFQKFFKTDTYSCTHADTAHAISLIELFWKRKKNWNKKWLNKFWYLSVVLFQISFLKSLWMISNKVNLIVHVKYIYMQITFRKVDVKTCCYIDKVCKRMFDALKVMIPSNGKFLGWWNYLFSSQKSFHLALCLTRPYINTIFKFKYFHSS